MSELLFSPTFGAEQIELAAAELSRRRQAGQTAGLLAQQYRPLRVADALAIQLHNAANYAQVIGWKCGLPSTDASGLPKIVLGPLYQSELQQGASCALWPSAAGLARVEPEYAYPLLSDVPPADTVLSDAEVFALFGTPHLALELIQSRYQADAGAGYPDQLADGLFNQGLWLGPVLSQPEQAQFNLQLTSATGEKHQYPARHPNDQPRAPLVWLVNFLRAQGVKLTAGQLVITGSFAGVLDLPFATQFTWQYGNEPAFQLAFCPR